MLGYNSGTLGIKIFYPNGNLMSSFGSYGSGNGQFNSPFGIAVDSSWNIYVADNSNYRIQKFSSGFTGTSIEMRVRTGASTNTADGTWASWSSACDVNNNSLVTLNPAGGNNACVKSGSSNGQYVQYEAVMNTLTGTNVPTLSGVTISTLPVFTPGWLISSPFNTTNAYGTVKDISWTADTTKGNVQFQIRSSADGTTWGTWCGPTACSATPNSVNSFATGTGAYYTLAAGANPINALNGTPANKNSQYFQYAAFLNSTDGAGDQRAHIWSAKHWFISWFGKCGIYAERII